MKITLIEPNVEDYWYEQKLQSDPSTMNYKPGYDVQYYGYRYNISWILCREKTKMEKIK